MMSDRRNKLRALIGTGVAFAVGGLLPYLFAAAPGAPAEDLVREVGPALQGPVRGGVVWRFVDKEAKQFYASPAVVGNRVYITSVSLSAFNPSGRGAIYCLDADTGDVVWSHEPRAYRATYSSPVIKGKYLVVGEGLHEIKDARVICLDVEAGEKARRGVPLWTYRTKSHVESTPAIGEDFVVVGAGDDGFYCFALEPGRNGKARVLWHLRGKGYPDCESSPAIHDGRVYLGLGTGGNAVVCVDAKTGRELWRVRTPYPVFARLTVAEGKVFAGMGSGNMVNSAEQLQANKRRSMQEAGASKARIEKAVRALAPGGEVWAIDVKTHKVAWKHRVGRTVLGGVAVADGHVYFGSRDGFLYCLSAAEGRLIARHDLRSPIVNTPAVGRENVYVATWDGTLYGLSRKDLAPVWKVALGHGTISSPAIGRGHVYVGTGSPVDAGEQCDVICAGRP